MAWEIETSNGITVDELALTPNSIEVDFIYQEVNHVFRVRIYPGHPTELGGFVFYVDRTNKELKILHHSFVRGTQAMRMTGKFHKVA